MYGPDGNPLNPFINDSYLFLNSNGQNETNNFGLGGSTETAYNGLKNLNSQTTSKALSSLNSAYKNPNHEGYNSLQYQRIR